MTVRVTARLEEAVVKVIDSAVAAGIAPSRPAVITLAVHEWLARHAEDSIVASYRSRYSSAEPQQDALAFTISKFAIPARLADLDR